MVDTCRDELVTSEVLVERRRGLGHADIIERQPGPALAITV